MPIEPRSSRVDAGDVSLVVHEWGGDGPVVLLAHPTGFHGRVWAPVAAGLVGAGRRVVSFDFRGHGDSDAPDIEYSWDGFADDVVAVATRCGVLGDPDAVVCGHSKGGAALLLAEHRMPGSFARIWTYEPIVFPADARFAATDDNPMSNTARRRRNEWASPEDAYAAYSSKPPLSDMTPESLRAYVDYGLRDRGDGVFALKCAPEIEARIYAMGPRNGAWAALPEIEPPVVVAFGARSRDIGPGLAARIVERLPHGRLEIWEDAGHFGPQADPPRAVASILALADR
ncbi:MAG TPA: alpha/beta hydrolase [Acidimicrobiia bacterium]|nr:alpha/beta hydrolase [Acidimicrobiia bacterium]